VSGRASASPVARISTGTVAAGLLSASLLALLVLPLVALLAAASPLALMNVLKDAGARTAAEFTLMASGAAVVIALGTGVPLGYLLARRSFPGRTIVSSVITLPIALPHLVAGLAIFLLFAPSTPVGATADRLGIRVLDSFWGVVLVMVYVSAPYVVLASELAFRAVDGSVLETARTLGAGPMTVFWTVTMPIAARGVVAGAVLSWARAVSEIGGFLIVASMVYPGAPYNGPATVPISLYVFNLFSIGDTDGAVAVSVWILLLAFALFLGIRLLERRGFLPWVSGEMPR
jgi:ABC-type sulfate transport system permease component